MSQIYDSYSNRNILHPDSLGRILPKQSSSSSIKSNGRRSSQLTNIKSVREISDTVMLQTIDNPHTLSIPGQNSAYLEVPRPAHTISRQGSLNILCPTPRGSTPDSMLGGDSIRKLVPSQVPSSSNSIVQSVFEGRNHSAPSCDPEIANHGERPEIIAPDRTIASLDKICPTWPSKIPRWDDTSKFNNPKIINHEVQAGKKDYSRPDTIHNSDWEWLTHPDGLPYFHHKEKHVITEAYIPSPEVRANVESTMEKLESIINDMPNFDATMHVDCPRVLSFQNDDGGNPIAHYYFVDHKHQSIFWPEDINGDELVYDLQVDDELSDAQFGLRITSEYWKHRWLYPGLQPVTARDIEQMRNAVHFAMLDNIFSNFSTSPFSYEVLVKIEGIMEKRIRVYLSPLSSPPEPQPDPILEILISQTLYEFSNKRFLDFYGERFSRLSSDQHLHPGSHAHKASSMFMTVLTYLLFFSPRAHLKKLTEVYVDFVVVQYSWKEYLDGLNQDWDAILILAGVILAVVVSFLAMPSVDTTSNNLPVNPSNPIQLLGYASVVSLIISIVIVLMLKSLFYKSKSNGQSAIAKASRTLQAAQESWFGLEGLAIVFSLPRVLLIWAIMLFAGAFFTLCFWKTTFITQMVFGVPTGLGASICIWSFWMLRISDVRDFISKIPNIFTMLSDPINQNSGKDNPDNDPAYLV